MPNNKIPDFDQMAKRLIEDAHRIAGTESVKFFKQSFINEGFTDAALTPWKKTTNPMAGHRTLFGGGEKGHLRDSIRKVSEVPGRIVVEAESKYAEIHNDGGTITVTKAMKMHFWKLYCETAGIKKDENGKTDWKNWTNAKTNKSGLSSSIKANRPMSSKARFFKKLALMKVGSKIKIPKRQFMGDSQTMMNLFDTKFAQKIELKFKQSVESTQI